MSDLTPTSFFLALAVGYVAGSIPFGLILTRAAWLGDIRKVGSGNIGATNVLRTGNKGLAALTLAFDVAKGTAPVLIAQHYLGPDAPLIAGLSAFLGHIFPVWLGFRGGKGVATCIGVLIGWSWQAALIFCAVWLVIAMFTRYSSLSALVASVAVPLFLFFRDAQPTLVLFSSLMTVLLLLKHHANIRRLITGEEPKIGAKA